MHLIWGKSSRLVLMLWEFPLNPKLTLKFQNKTPHPARAILLVGIPKAAILLFRLWVQRELEGSLCRWDFTREQPKRSLWSFWKKRWDCQGRANSPLASDWPAIRALGTGTVPPSGLPDPKEPGPRANGWYNDPTLDEMKRRNVSMAYTGSIPGEATARGMQRESAHDGLACQGIMV
jgi:hypothetical protein